MDEGCTAIVPMVRVSPLPGTTQLSLGSECDVLWSDRKHFTGILILSGEYLVILSATHHITNVNVRNKE